MMMRRVLTTAAVLLAGMFHLSLTKTADAGPIGAFSKCTAGCAEIVQKDQSRPLDQEGDVLVHKAGVYFGFGYPGYYRRPYYGYYGYRPRYYTPYSPYYGYPGYYYRPRVYVPIIPYRSYRPRRRRYAYGSCGRPWTGAWRRCCSHKYRSFSARTGRYVTYSGRRRFCR